MEIGNVVEYIDRQKIICAVILQVKGRRLRLLTQYNREVKLSAGRIIHIGSERLDVSVGRDRLVDLLDLRIARRRQLVEAIDVIVLWERLNGRQQWLSLEEMASLCFEGVLEDDHRSAVIRAFFDHRTHFKFDRDRFLPLSPDTVARAAEQIRRQVERERVIEEGGRWLRQAMQGETPSVKAPFTPLQQAVVEVLKASLIHGKESTEYGLARSIFQRSGLPSDQDLFVFLVQLGIWDRHENIELYRQRIPTTFSEETLRRAGNQCHTASDPAVLADRRDLSHLTTLTIDGQSTLDFDDALSIEQTGDYLRLGIHVADVAHVVRRGDPVDREALERGSSIYMPDAKIPMLPPPLAEGLCSLKAGEVRPAISLMVTLDSNGGYVGDEIVPSLIRVNEQMTYYEANQAFEENPTLKIMAEIASGFRRSRLEAGAIQITLPEIHVWLDEQQKVRINRINRESPGRMLVSEIMILANRLMAKFLAERGIPTVFRSQTGPRSRLYKGMEGTLFQNWMQRKLLNRFHLKTSPERHSGLGLDAYTTGTSPIRKYFDLITQRQIRSAFRLEQPYSADEIQQLIATLDPVMRRVAKIQNDRHRYWILQHLESGIGTKEEALVLYRFRNSYRVLLTRFMMECDLPASTGMELRAESLIQVTLQHVDARKNVISIFAG